MVMLDILKKIAQTLHYNTKSKVDNMPKECVFQ